MSDLINRSKLLRKFSVNSNGDKIPEYDIDNFPATLSVKDIKEIIRNEPTISDKEIRNKVIDEFAESIKATLPITVHRNYSEVGYEVDYVLYRLRNRIDRIAEGMKSS